MEFQTPGVYVREVDSGSKPIASVPTSIPGFLGLFHHTPATDAVAINASGSGGAITGKVLPQLVDASGAAKEADAGAALTAAFNFKSRQVKDLKKSRCAIGRASGPGVLYTNCLFVAALHIIDYGPPCYMGH